MFGLFILVGYGLPVITLGAAAAVGLFTARYFRGQPESVNTTYHVDPRLVAAMWLAVAFPVVACFSLVLPTFVEIQKLYGRLVELLWVWALCSFAIGGVFGWTSVGEPPRQGG
jgi:hypothetical protein